MDNKTNQELFKQALVEGVNRRLDREIAAYDEDITYSRRHIKNMARIVNGKTPRKPLSTKMIAILVAAAILLLAGCAIIYRNEIRDFITDVQEFFVKVTFDKGESESSVIDEIYELTYIPEGYVCEDHYINLNLVQYIFKDSEQNIIKFVQRPLDMSSFMVDIEHDYDKFANVGGYEIYYRHTNGTYYYIWNDGKYALKLNLTEELSLQELELIINGIRSK